MGNGYSELNDPFDQLERFMDQQAKRESGDEEAQMLDIDFVEMLEYGMPPNSGMGVSERLFWFFEDITAREGTIFPQMKYKLEETTRKLYGIKDKTKKAAREKMTKSTGTPTTLENSQLPSREDAMEKLLEHVEDEYQVLHAKMVANCMEAYAQKLGEDKELWYITGLVHDIDYCEHKEEHPARSLDWFGKWGYPEAVIHAVAAHAIEKPRVEPKTKLAEALIATDELTGLLYAYSLMRPNKWEGMKASSIKKKFKDKAFAAKIDRKEIQYGMDAFGVELSEHAPFLVETLKKMQELQ